MIVPRAKLIMDYSTVTFATRRSLDIAFHAFTAPASMSVNSVSLPWTMKKSISSKLLPRLNRLAWVKMVQPSTPLPLAKDKMLVLPAKMSVAMKLVFQTTCLPKVGRYTIQLK